MATTKADSGELEVVLGSKQLLSVFFVVVILLALFFVMGYIVGRNSVPPQVTEINPAPRVDGRNPYGDVTAVRPTETRPSESTIPEEPKPVIVPPADSSRKTAANLPSDQVPAMRETLKDQPKPETKKPEIKTISEESKPAETKAKKEEPRKEPKPDRAEKREEKKPEVVTTGAPRAGHYLQVAAIPEKDAKSLANILRNKHFSVQLATANKDDLFRVLVGPVGDKSELTKLRESLDVAGFSGKKAIPRKY